MSAKRGTSLASGRGSNGGGKYIFAHHPTTHTPIHTFTCTHMHTNARTQTYMHTCTHITRTHSAAQRVEIAADYNGDLATPAPAPGTFQDTVVNNVLELLPAAEDPAVVLQVHCVHHHLARKGR